MSDDGKPPFDARFAQQYVGKYVLVGMSRYSAEGQLLAREQFHGVIAGVTDRAVSVELRGKRAGEVKTLPPDFRSLQLAPPGEYTLRETQEVIYNPDLLWTWDIKEWPK